MPEDQIKAALAARGLSYEAWLDVMTAGLLNFGKVPAVMGLSDVMQFGKYAGRTVEQVCRADPAWMSWVLSQPTSYWFTKGVTALVDQLRGQPQS